MRRLLFLVIWMGWFFHLSAQSLLPLQSFGARSLGMGGVKHFVLDSWSIFNHIGGLDRVEQSMIGANFDQRFGIKELSTMGLSGAWKTGFGTAGIGVARFGSSLFNQQMLGLGFSNTMGIVSFGAKMDWHQTQIEGFGSGHAWMLTFGGVAELSPEFFIGAQVTNVNQARFSRFSENRLPSTVQLGIAYVPYSNTKIILETEKPLEGNPRARIGLEHSLKNWLYLRAGVSSHPTKLHFGLGIRRDWFGFDYALGQQTALGNSHHFSLIFQLDAK
jgi:hypothetical protein